MKLYKACRLHNPIVLCVFVLMALLLGGCASDTRLTVNSDDWTYESKAITIEVHATADLNSVNERPHALALAIFQLNDTNTFTGLTSTREGTTELLTKGRVDNTIAQYTRIIIQPGEKRTIMLDRAQTARYVGVVAGYHMLNPALDVKLFEVPVVPSKRGLVDKALVSMSLIADEGRAFPAPMHLQIELEGQGTRRMLINEDRSR